MRIAGLKAEAKILPFVRSHVRSYSSGLNVARSKPFSAS